MGVDLELITEKVEDLTSASVPTVLTAGEQVTALKFADRLAILGLLAIGCRLAGSDFCRSGDLQ